MFGRGQEGGRVQNMGESFMLVPAESLDLDLRCLKRIAGGLPCNRDLLSCRWRDPPSVAAVKRRRSL
jgi:hypothetical protein